MLEPTTIRSGRKIAINDSIKRLLFDTDQEDPDPSGSVYWHYYKNTVLTISNEIIDHDDYRLVVDDLRDSITGTIEKGNSAIYVPKSVHDSLKQQLDHHEQTIAEFLTQMLGVSEDELLATYDDSTEYFASRDALKRMLSEDMTRYAFYLVADRLRPGGSIAIHILTQEQLADADIHAVAEMLHHHQLIEDRRVMMVLTYFADQFSDMLRDMDDPTYHAFVMQDPVEARDVLDRVCASSA